MNNKLAIDYIGKETQSTHWRTFLADVYELRISRDLRSYQLMQDLVYDSGKGFFSLREDAESDVDKSFCVVLEHNCIQKNLFEGCFSNNRDEISSYLRVIFEDGLDPEFFDWGIKSLVVNFDSDSKILSIMG